jgi:hypothetical protein
VKTSAPLALENRPNYLKPKTKPPTIPHILKKMTTIVNHVTIPGRGRLRACLALFLTSVILYLIPGTSHAATVTVSGGFEVTFNPENPTYQGISQFSGIWEFTYDDLGGSHTGTVAGTFTNLEFSSINDVFGPYSAITVGTTDFDTSNMTISITLDSGAINGFLLAGGIPSPSQDFLRFNYVHYVQNGITLEEVNDGLYQVDLGSANIAGTNSVSRFNSSQGFINPASGFTVVPEPGSVLLLGSGLLSFLRRRRPDF